MAKFNEKAIKDGNYPSPRDAVEIINKRMIKQLKNSKLYKQSDQLEQIILLQEFEHNFKLHEMEYMEIQEKLFDQMASKMNIRK